MKNFKRLILKLIITAITGILITNKFVTQIAASPPVHQSSVTCKGTSVAQIVCAVTGGTNQLYVVNVGIRNNVDVNNVSGLGLSWTQRKEQCAAGQNTRIETWTAFGSPANGSVTIYFASTALTAVGAVSRYSNVDPTSPVQNPAGSNETGQNGSCVDGFNSNTPSLNLTSTVNDSILIGALNSGPRVITTSDPAYIQRAYDLISSNASSIYVHDRVLTTAGTDTLNHIMDSSYDWAMSGLVIRPLIAVPTSTLTRTPTPLPPSPTRTRTPTPTRTRTPTPTRTLTPTQTLTPAATLTPTDTPTPTQIPVGPNLDQVNAIYSYSGLGYYTLSPTFDGNRTTNKDMTIFLISGSLEIPADFSMADPQDSVIFIVNGNIFVNGNVTRIPGVYISSQTFTVAPSENPIVIEGMVYANKINLGRTFYSLTEPTYQIIYQPKYIIDLLPYLGRPQVNWQEVIQ